MSAFRSPRSGCGSVARLVALVCSAVTVAWSRSAPQYAEGSMGARRFRVWAVAVSISLAPVFAALSQTPFSVEIMRAVPQGKGSIVLDVAVVNPGIGPSGILIDPTFSPHEEIGRPSCVVSFTIVDRASRRVKWKAEDEVDAVPEASDPSGLLVLGPGQLFGSRIALGSNPQFPYRFGPGEYRIRAKVCIVLKDFAERYPDYRTELERIHGPHGLATSPVVTQGCAESNTVIVKIPPHGGSSGR
jgi:hypothetical protein